MYIPVIRGISLILLAFVLPVTWQTRGFFACLSLRLIFMNHFIMPSVLNPPLMSFTFCNDKNCEAGHLSDDR
jgi:hypothetical protein